MENLIPGISGFNRKEVIRFIQAGMAEQREQAVLDSCDHADKTRR